MLSEGLILRSKLTPPRPPRHVLLRAALTARLRAALECRLTLVQAGTGYGKTTALAALADGSIPLFWYSADEQDADAQRWLAHLIACFRLGLPRLSDAPLALLRERHADEARRSLQQVLDALLNALHETLSAPSLLVIDDAHLITAAAESGALLERLIEFAPPALHLVLATRYPLPWAGLARWRARGDVLEINRAQLAFTVEEIATLFRETYGLACSADEISALADKTEGWPIALQMVWQGLRNGVAGDAATLLAQGPTTLAALFDYLACDVLGKLPPTIATFLRETAVLRELTPEACAAVTGRDDSADLLQQIDELNLFIVALGERHYRYHHLFHDFLRQQAAAEPDALRARHVRAAQFFAARGTADEAIFHWLAAGEHAAAAVAIAQAGERVLRQGQLATLLGWIDALPPAIVAEQPALQALLGDAYRLRSRFDEALAWYQQAEQTWRARGDLSGVSRALRGQALVFLDQVRPAQAEHLLQEALRISDRIADRQAQARLLTMLAENKLNLGKPAEAEHLRAAARALRDEGPGEDLLSVRVKLRTGQLDTAQRLLEAWTDTRAPTLPPKGQREALLILALIHVLRGQAAPGQARAEQGLALSQELQSPFGTAVAQMRLGHARQLQACTAPPAQRATLLAEAARCYETAVALGDELSVRRIRAEAMWGLTRLAGFHGDPQTAQRRAAEGVEVCVWAGDQWLAAMIELTLGASLLLAGQDEAATELLSRVLAAFRGCGDRFGQAATRLWLALAYHRQGQVAALLACLDELLALGETQRYDFLFGAAPTLLGPPDPRCLVPLLVTARHHGRHAAYARRLLAGLGLSSVQIHPGYQLRVWTLGQFRVARGEQEVEPRDWQRDKARQLFQLLLTCRDRWLQRDEIAELLWPHLSPEAAARDFKVALNALNKALEPGRAPDAPFAFVVRDGTAYRLRPEADLWLDAAAFEEGCREGLRLLDRDAAAGMARLSAALELYGGEYLPDALYEDWALVTRDRLRALFLHAATRLAEAWLERERLDASIALVQRMLGYDRCWEPAYRLLLRIYARQGNRALIERVYQRCAATLQEQLGIDPSPETVRLYSRLAR